MEDQKKEISSLLRRKLETCSRIKILYGYKLSANSLGSPESQMNLKVKITSTSEKTTN